MASTAAVAASAALPKMVGAAAADVAAKGPSTLTFTQVSYEIGERHQVAPGYDPRVLIRWGDKVVEGAPPVRPTASDQPRAGKAIRLQLRLHRLPAAAPWLE